jgi:hypothetical protein
VVSSLARYRGQADDGFDAVIENRAVRRGKSKGVASSQPVVKAPPLDTLPKDKSKASHPLPKPTRPVKGSSECDIYMLSTDYRAGREQSVQSQDDESVIPPPSDDYRGDVFDEGETEDDDVTQDDPEGARATPMPAIYQLGKDHNAKSPPQRVERSRDIR